MYKGISWAQTQCKPILQQPDFLVDLQSLRWTNFPWTESSFLRGQLDQTAGLRGLACTFAPGIPSGLMISRGSPKKKYVLSKWQSSVTGTYWNNCWSNLMIWVSQHFWNPPCGYCLSSIQLAADSTWSGWKRRSNSLKRLCGLRWIWNGNPHFGIGNHP